ncbi:hypothetical protein [Microbacterium aoyamense]|uniref:hypothetical protein n=1 Tax=Microbacterium aoyamense TaxID=344166 RepID=UPI002004C529|nr:hypothetical protein [Microbacterium aoyamense]
MITAEWTPHRRDDRELLGWIRPEGADWVAVDLLGREATGPVEWLDAEDALEAGGLAWLAEVWMLETDDGAIRVRIAEVTPPGRPGDAGRVVVHSDDFGSVDVPYTRYELAWPAPAELRHKRPGEASELQNF